MNKRILMAACLLVATAGVIHADEERSLTVSQTDGNEQQIAVTDIQRIHWKDGAMIIELSSGETLTYPISQIATITFNNPSTAIEQLATEQAEQPYIVSDLMGRTIFEGITTEEGKVKEELPTLKGTYIVTVNGKSHKVLFNNK